MKSIHLAIDVELCRARANFPAFHSTHEGIAVIREEYLELEQAVFGQQSDYDLDAMRAECIQLAAMAVRFIEDCLEES